MFKISKFSILAVFALFTLTFVACGDDDVTGCTDEAAENYDPEATVSGDCTYAADKFLGEYFGSSACSGALLIPALSNDSLIFEIQEKVGAGPNDVTVLLSVQGVPVAFDASVSGDVLTVNALIEGIVFPTDPAMTMIDITATGPMTYDATNNSTTGTLSITLMSSVTGSTIDTGECVITGVKQ